MSKKFNYAIPVILMVLLAACKNASSPNRVWVVSTLAGTGEGAFLDHETDPKMAKFYHPTGVAVDKSGNIYVADYYNHRIRKITSAGAASTLAGGTRGHTEGTGTAAQFNRPSGVAVYEKVVNGNKELEIYVADTYNHRIRKITSSGVVSTIAGSGSTTTGGYVDGAGTAARFNRPSGVAVYEYEEDGEKKLDIYVADSYNHRIRKIEMDSEGDAISVSTIAGSGSTGVFAGGYVDGIGTAAQFKFPTGVAVYEYEEGGEKKYNIYVADGSNHRIRKIAPDPDNPNDSTKAKVSTLAGTDDGDFLDHATDPKMAKFNRPSGVAVDSSGNIYVADTYNHRIRKIEMDSEGDAISVSTIAGSTEGYVNGAGTAAQFNNPSGVAVDSSGSIYVADEDNHRIRKIEYRVP